VGVARNATLAPAQADVNAHGVGRELFAGMRRNASRRGRRLHLVVNTENIPMLDTLSLASHGPVIPVIVIQRLEDAVPLAEALVAGGVRVLEVTLRTAVALQAMEAMAKVPGAIVGAGTLRSPTDVTNAKNAGCQFGVSPGYTDALAAACKTAGLPLLPGVSTASEVMQANAAGFNF
jgi:2-dehydro-3-deoxyphosphogluconate aldolase/(4S)-4-hydroxy-2-oxoglutarate aldolase